MATIYVDEKPYRVDAKQNLLHACLTLGFNLPYFCWHPALGSVGACRQCAVKQFRTPDDKHGRLVMACMTPAAEGTRISIRDPEAVAFRAGIIEGMMLNHPHDCPVCDEGGECHLQDMTVMTGHDYRRYNFRKRTFRNQYLGPFVNHEMNRCIQCYRCVRFYREYAGGKDFNVFAIRNLAYFGRYEDGVLESEFAGNLDEVCPTGVFTDATHKRHYTRKWDLQFAPSICVHCGLGCNISPGERYGVLRRIVNRYHGDINRYFLCDRGRHGYEFVNSQQRIRQARRRRDGQLQAITKAEALEELGNLVRESKAIGIGSPRASLEANLALRTAVGRDRFFVGIADEELHLLNLVLDILRSGPAPAASLREVEFSDAVLVLGEDVTNFAPRMALSLRQSVRQQPIAIADKLKIPRWLDHAVREALQDRKGPLFIATPTATRLDDVAIDNYHAAPDDLARLGFAVTHALDRNAPAVADLPQEVVSLAERVAEALRVAQHPLVISGLGCCSEAVIKAAANVTRALHRIGRPARIAFTVPECNSLGLALLGGQPLSGAFAAVRDGAADTVIVLENDLYRRMPAGEVDTCLRGARHLIVLDYLDNPTSAMAELLLPAGTFAEADGTLVNHEGRAQRFFQVFVPDGDIQESWRWLRDGMSAAGRREFAAWEKLDDVIVALGAESPALAHVSEAAPLSSFRMAGEKIARQPHRYSGRTAMLANIDVSEPKPPDDSDSPLAFSMEGNPDQPPSPLIPFFWAPGWNSYQAVNKFQEEIAGPLRGDYPGVRLIEPPVEAHAEYFTGVPSRFRSGEEWLVVPLYHIFGSEELSVLSPGVKELSPQAYLAMNEDDAARLGLHAEEAVEFAIAGNSYRLPLKVRS
ncbi:MAG TPA: NADH-quinone oxidoreductase subunit NuoG, partial [Terriglobales bacterium]|nr:NADH-quinone oxidoreductase subunit NuoG [Terriglobales bacterium]